MLQVDHHGSIMIRFAALLQPTLSKLLSHLPSRTLPPPPAAATAVATAIAKASATAVATICDRPCAPWLPPPRHAAHVRAASSHARPNNTNSFCCKPLIATNHRYVRDQQNEWTGKRWVKLRAAWFAAAACPARQSGAGQGGGSGRSYVGLGGGGLCIATGRGRWSPPLKADRSGWG